MNTTGKIIGAAIPLMQANINTDIIMPQTELVTTTKTNLGKGIFARWRYQLNGEENPHFVLNQSKYKNGKVLLTGKNFGCGSSREHAVWGILDFGIRCIIAPSFAEIFRDNAYRNKLLLIEIEQEILTLLVKEIELTPQEYLLTINLNELQVETATQKLIFNFTNEAHEYFLQAVDYIDNTLTHISDIEIYQQQDKVKRPWVYQFD